MYGTFVPSSFTAFSSFPKAVFIDEMGILFIAFMEQADIMYHQVHSSTMNLRVRNNFFFSIAYSSTSSDLVPTMLAAGLVAVPHYP